MRQRSAGKFVPHHYCVILSSARQSVVMKSIWVVPVVELLILVFILKDPKPAKGQRRVMTALQVKMVVSGVPTFMVCRSEEHTSELQSLRHLVCRLLLEKKNTH